MAEIIRVIDFETTGHEPTEEGDIIEVGWCDLIGAGSVWLVGAPRSMIVRPTKPILIEAMAVHHLQYADVAGARYDRASALWNARNDMPVTAGSDANAAGPNIIAFAAHGAKTEQALWPESGLPWICTYKLAVRTWPDSPRFSNQVLRYYLKLDVDPNLGMPPHRAGPDAYVTALMLQKGLESGITIEDAIAWTDQPALLPRVTFGEHRGKSWRDIEYSLLEWVLRKDFSEDVMYTVRVEIDRRDAEYRRNHPCYEEERADER